MEIWGPIGTEMCTQSSEVQFSERPKLIHHRWTKAWAKSKHWRGKAAFEVVTMRLSLELKLQ